jgi:hypothetical protein
MDILTHTWHWSISGFVIGMIMLSLIYFGKQFGMSSNLRSLCSMTGIGKKVSFFDWDWKSQRWNLVVVLGAMIGGYVAVHFLSDASNVDLNPTTIEQLATMNIEAPNGKLVPESIFWKPSVIIAKNDWDFAFGWFVNWFLVRAMLEVVLLVMLFQD